MNGFTINSTIVEKAIARYVRGGWVVDVDRARAIGHRMIAAGNTYDSATEAAELFKCRIWNEGCVR